jgi:hypothetical protein
MIKSLPAISVLPPLATQLAKDELINWSRARDHTATSIYDALRWVAKDNTIGFADTLKKIAATLKEGIDRRPYHRASIFTKFDVEQYGPGLLAVPRLLGGIQFTKDPTGKFWGPEDRGVECVGALLSPGKDLSELTANVTRQANHWLAANKDKRIAGMTMMYQKLMSSGCRFAGAEESHKHARMIVVFHWEKLDKPLPLSMERKLNLVHHPQVQANIETPFDYRGAEAAINKVVSGSVYREVTGVSLLHRKEERPGDEDRLPKDFWIAALLTEEDLSKRKLAPEQRFEFVVGYGGTGIDHSKLEWAERATNLSLSRNAAWDVRSMTHQFFYGELPEHGGGTAARSMTGFLYEKPREGPGRNPSGRRAFRIWVQAHEAPIGASGGRDYWPGADYDKAIEGRVALTQAHRPGWLVRHNKAQHDWGQFFEGDSPTDRMIGAMLEEEAPRDEATLSVSPYGGLKMPTR